MRSYIDRIHYRENRIFYNRAVREGRMKLYWQKTMRAVKNRPDFRQ